MASIAETNGVTADHVTTTSLDALQNGDQRKIMDVVDKLRRTGLSGVLQLPQIVVCGDQSSGKSSVLEAITEIPFPRKENLCTRFATEIVLRRDHTSSISTKITPDKTRPSNEQKKLQEFRKTIVDFTELPALIEEATILMGLDDPESSLTAFSRDVLSIEICGPGRPQLTLVDLPGLIHSGNKSQSDHDVKLIHELVNDYISNNRTIILAVVSAKNDYANQIILEKARKVDPKGSRTLGIITKPDFLRAGSDNERDWIELANNQDIYFELGWHMLRNRGDGDLGASFAERNLNESAFFSKGRYRDLPRTMVGIESLRQRLSALLTNHLRRELPDLKIELDKKLLEVNESLNKLGASRATAYEQRQYLMGLAMSAHDILKSAVGGHYEDNFFGPVDTKADVSAIENHRRLRAVVQHLNLSFAELMRRHGRKFAIASTEHDSENETDPADEDFGDMLAGLGEMKLLSSTFKTFLPNQDPPNQRILAPKPIPMSREDAVQWVLQVLQRSRGRELPGNYNPLLISHLFWEQSEPWKIIAESHIDIVALQCSQFVESLLSHVTTPDIAGRLASLRIEAALKTALEHSHAELDRIMEDNRRHPSTYNHYYTTTIQKSRSKKYGRALLHSANKAKVTINRGESESSRPTDYIDPTELEKALSSQTELDMDKFSAEEALDSQVAYYKDELKYFIGAVTKQVIERHLVAPLPKDILSPMLIAAMTNEEVSYVAAEPQDVIAQRQHLEGRKKMLESGAETFRLAMGALR